MASRSFRRGVSASPGGPAVPFSGVPNGTPDAASKSSSPGELDLADARNEGVGVEEVREVLGQVKVEDDRTGRPAPFASVADTWQQDDIDAILPGLLQAMGYPQAGEVCKRHFWQRSRGHSKTAD